MSATNGLIILKKQKGRYAIVATPKVADMYAPHVFQGISGEVMVPASSKVRDKTLGSIFLLLYSSLYMRPGKTTEIYWSEVMIFAPIQVAIVVAIRVPVLCAKYRA